MDRFRVCPKIADGVRQAVVISCEGRSLLISVDLFVFSHFTRELTHHVGAPVDPDHQVRYVLPLGMSRGRAVAMMHGGMAG